MNLRNPSVLVALSALLPTGLQAQGEAQVVPVLAAAADKDRDGEVTPDEWSALLSTVASGAEIDTDALFAIAMTAQVDANGDGQVSPDEYRAVMPPRRARDLRSVPDYAADVNLDGTTDNKERLEAIDQGWDAKRIMRQARQTRESDRTAFTAGVLLVTIEAALDFNSNGRRERADLEKIFEAVDRDRNGSWSNTEKRAGLRRGRDANATRGMGSYRRITATDRSRPTLINWQRNLDDALTLVAKTSKPLLICVNTDGEPLSERLAWGFYRDPVFAELTEGFVCVIASPDQREPRAFDDRGLRVPDRKFGQVLNQEHIDIEPGLYEKYFNNNRVAPRHVGVAPNGEILFDLFLINDVGRIASAMREHGKPDKKLPTISGTNLEELSKSPNAQDRTRFEQAIAKADAATRRRYVGRALDPKQTIRHPSLVRLGLSDEDASVRAAAVQTMIEGADETDFLMLSPTFREIGDDVRTAEKLIFRLRDACGDAAKDETQKLSALRVAKLQEALRTTTKVVDVKGWTDAVTGRQATLTDTRPELRGDLDTKLEELEKQIRTAVGKAKVPLQIELAETQLLYSRVLVSGGGQPTFALQDALATARRLFDEPSVAGRAYGVAAWAGYLLTDPKAADWAEKAVPLLLDEMPDSELACYALDTLSKARRSQLYQSVPADQDWPLTHVADVVAAGQALLAHPYLTQQMATELLDFLDWCGGYWLEGQENRRALARLPYDAGVHQRLRAQILRDEGADAVGRVYGALDFGPEAQATIDWYAGAAHLDAATHCVNGRSLDRAQKQYGMVVDKMAAAIRSAPGFADSANHYVAFAHSGLARLALDRGDLDAADRSIRDALRARVASAELQDGLGNSPATNAQTIVRALRAAGRDDAAKSLSDELKRIGVGG